MSYLGIDHQGAHVLAGWLRRDASRIEPLQQLVVEAESLADWPVHVTLVLEQILTDYRLSAVQIDRAVSWVESFRLRPADVSSWGSQAAPTPRRTPAPIVRDVDQPYGPESPSSPQWNAQPDMAWNLVQQDASHNSYAVAGGIAALYDHGLRTFELDIHRGSLSALSPLTAPWLWARSLFETATRHLERDAGRRSDWNVYHLNELGHSEYDSLSEGLAAVAALETSDPLTVFVDNKDRFGDAHTPEQFDLILDHQLGERLYTPTDLLGRVPHAQTLHEAVQRAGWPTVAELSGRIMVVLTDNIGGYTSGTSRAFVAPAPLLRGSGEGVVHLSDPNAVFYNANGRGFDSADITAVLSGSNLLRTYFNPRCGPATIESSLIAPNFRAIDVGPDARECGSPVPVPPEGVPVPINGLGDLEQPFRGVEVDQ